MREVVSDGEWRTRRVTDGKVHRVYKAGDMMQWIAEAAWQCGDPGLQFKTTLNEWHTSPNAGPINACNPCSEYVFLDNSACNLSSLNLMKFLKPDGQFDTKSFRHAVSVLILAQEIIVEQLQLSHRRDRRDQSRLQDVGIGIRESGRVPDGAGSAYDSDQARNTAAAITALMTGQAYLTSARIAERMGTFAGFESNRIPMMGVIHKHRSALSQIDSALVPMNCFTRHGSLGRSHREGDSSGLPERTGDSAGADGNHRLHDGLRHHRHRAGLLTGEDQEAGRWRHPQDRQPHHSPRAPDSGVRRGGAERRFWITSTGKIR